MFDELPRLERLEALTEVGNARSQREGVLRSYIVFPGAGGDEAKNAAVYSFISSDRARLT